MACTEKEMDSKKKEREEKMTKKKNEKPNVAIVDMVGEWRETGTDWCPKIKARVALQSRITKIYLANLGNPVHKSIASDEWCCKEKVDNGCNRIQCPRYIGYVRNFKPGGIKGD